jgi:hypothetical protein
MCPGILKTDVSFPGAGCCIREGVVLTVVQLSSNNNGAIDLRPNELSKSIQ